MAAKDQARRRAAGRITAATRWGGPDNPQLPELYAALRRAELEDHVKRLVAQIPPLTDEQRGKIVALLFATPVAAEVAASDSDPGS